MINFLPIPLIQLKKKKELAESPLNTISHNYKNFSEPSLPSEYMETTEITSTTYNLEKELKDKKDEFKLLKKNYKDKILLLGIGNKKY